MQDYITLLNEALKMTSVSSIGAQVNDHIECCEHARRIRINNLSLDTVIESGYSVLLIRNYLEGGFNITKLSYNEICNLSWLLTKELEVEVKRPFYLLELKCLEC
jgi:hypothetical protein